MGVRNIESGFANDQQLVLGGGGVVVGALTSSPQSPQTRSSSMFTTMSNAHYHVAVVGLQCAQLDTSRRLQIHHWPNSHCPNPR